MKLYRYTGSNRYHGVDARDYTEDEFATLSPRAQRVIETVDDWTAETVRKDSDAAEKARRAAGPAPVQTDADGADKTGQEG